MDRLARNLDDLRSLVHRLTRKGVRIECRRRKALSPEQALRKRAGAGEQKTGLAREFGISRETLYQYLRTES
jgi:DNA invertase Pin-like site-specific DNA recombinase